MFPISQSWKMTVIPALIMAALAGMARADNPANKFHRAYYLERGDGNFAAAAQLYGEVLAGRGVDADMRTTAKARLEVCREEIATVDFAQIMPPAPLAYVELNRPGERFGKLLGQLGLLAGPDNASTGENHLAISPAVIDAALGLRGVAVAITGFDPMAQQPAGVAVLHAGDIELIRGLIETALPAGTNIVDPVGGYPTYEIEGVYVTLTRRLVIAGSTTGLIADVIDRIKHDDSDSLATDADMAEVLSAREGALLFFCVNPKPLMPLINGMLAGAAQHNSEVAMAQALLDIGSFRSLAGRFDVSDAGLSLDLTLRLDEGHRNLVYNFFRRPALDPETLRRIPAGAAGFLAMSMNEAPSNYGRPESTSPDKRPVVTALDIGRELFANINGIAIYAMPPADGVRPTGPIPDIAAVITVNDPSKSQALWGQILGLASVAAGAPTMDGEPHEVAGVAARGYRFEDGPTIQFAIVGHDLLIASTETALARSIEAGQGGQSILDDPAFAAPLANIGRHTTLAVVAHPGRCAELARPFMSPGEVKEMEPFVGLLTDTTAALLVSHSNEMLQFSMAVAGIPNVSGLVSRMLTEQRQSERTSRALAQAVSGKDWNAALALLDERLADDPTDTRNLKSKFNVLAVHQGNQAAALALADDLFTHMSDDATALNNFAWALLTEDRYNNDYDELALRFARRSDEITKRGNWMFVDTLALAEFKTGNSEAAVELEEKAIELCQRTDGGGLDELQAALARFRGDATTEN